MYFKRMEYGNTGGGEGGGGGRGGGGVSGEGNVRWGGRREGEKRKDNVKIHTHTHALLIPI